MLESLQPWFPDLGTFLAMGRHGVYVWCSVAVVALALLAEQLALRAQARPQRPPSRLQRDPS